MLHVVPNPAVSMISSLAVTFPPQGGGSPVTSCGSTRSRYGHRVISVPAVTSAYGENIVEFCG